MAVLLELAPRCWSDRAGGRWPVQSIDSPQPECCERRQAEQLRPELRAFIVAQSTHLLQAVLSTLCGRARCVCEPLRVVAVLSCEIGTEEERRAARGRSQPGCSSPELRFEPGRLQQRQDVEHQEAPHAAPGYKTNAPRVQPPLLLSFLFLCRIFHYLACFTRFKPL